MAEPGIPIRPSRLQGATQRAAQPGVFVGRRIAGSIQWRLSLTNQDVGDSNRLKRGRLDEASMPGAPAPADRRPLSSRRHAQSKPPRGLDCHRWPHSARRRAPRSAPAGRLEPQAGCSADAAGRDQIQKPAPAPLYVRRPIFSAAALDLAHPGPCCRDQRGVAHRHLLPAHMGTSRSCVAAVVDAFNRRMVRGRWPTIRAPNSFSDSYHSVSPPPPARHRDLPPRGLRTPVLDSPTNT